MKLSFVTKIVAVSLLAGLSTSAVTKVQAASTPTISVSSTKELPSGFLREEVPLGFGDDGGGGGQDWSIWPEP